jgi:LuxR family maltose regulon positive regulatory protein
LRTQEDLLPVRWDFAQERFSDVIRSLEDVADEEYRAGRIRNWLEVQVLMALSYAADKSLSEARAFLRDVLAQTHVEGYLRLFLDEGDAMASLLRSSLSGIRAKPVRDYAQTILQAFGEIEKPDASRTEIQGAMLLNEPLSSQEQRVLRLLAAGRSNPQIAQELVVSVNTVRSQVQSIYRKLNVNNRVEASEVARHLKLI